MMLDWHCDRSEAILAAQATRFLAHSQDMAYDHPPRHLLRCPSSSPPTFQDDGITVQKLLAVPQEGSRMPRCRLQIHRQALRAAGTGVQGHAVAGVRCRTGTGEH